ncbi:MAG: DUF2255 family protein, partial [Chloroflexota bacterium]
VEPALLREEQKIRIETAASEAGPRHSTTIWVVVDPAGRVLIRSYRGAGARWYREVTSRPDCHLKVAGRMLAVRAIAAADPDRVAACSDGLLVKYVGQYGVRSMVSAHLETTLELVPR